MSWRRVTMASCLALTSCSVATAAFSLSQISRAARAASMAAVPSCGSVGAAAPPPGPGWWWWWWWWKRSGDMLGEAGAGGGWCSTQPIGSGGIGSSAAGVASPDAAGGVAAAAEAVGQDAALPAASSSDAGCGGSDSGPLAGRTCGAAPVTGLPEPSAAGGAAAAWCATSMWRCFEMEDGSGGGTPFIRVSRRRTTEPLRRISMLTPWPRRVSQISSKAAQSRPSTTRRETRAQR
mmetsp:Transcript_2815/g.8343  ORF Transcript_2815/g.8343 Transcript_2815/m.8343 type:complete len:235 (-) Transcript_2815:459-1163(-)